MKDIQYDGTNYKEFKGPDMQTDLDFFGILNG